MHCITSIDPDVLNDGTFYTVAEIAKALDVSVSTIHRWHGSRSHPFPIKRLEGHSTYFASGKAVKRWFEEAFA